MLHSNGPAVTAPCGSTRFCEVPDPVPREDIALVHFGGIHAIDAMLCKLFMLLGRVWGVGLSGNRFWQIMKMLYKLVNKISFFCAHSGRPYFIDFCKFPNVA